MESFSVRCIFRWDTRPDQKAKYLYEERITLWQASSLEQALNLAEKEASTYGSGDMEYLGFLQAFALFDLIPASSIEVFSLLRESDLEPKQYLDAFFDTGHERSA